MHKITSFRLNKRFLTIVSVLTLIFSSVVYGLSPRTTFDHNLNSAYLFMDVEPECNDENIVFGPITEEIALLNGYSKTLNETYSSSPTEITGWFFECGNDKKVDEYGFNANCNQTTVANIPSPGSIYKYVVEVVYKGGNPGSSIQVKDASNNNHTLQRSVPFGSSSNIWVYRGVINGSTSKITYTNSNSTCQLQSIVVYAFRNSPGASGSAGIFTNRSGYNDVQTINIDIPSFDVPRDLIIETPISEMTTDGRYLLLKASAAIGGGATITDQIFVYGPDASLPGASCCLTIPNLILKNVPGDVTQVTLTIDTRNGQNGQSVNGQSWVIAGGVNVDAVCENNPQIALIKTGTFNDNNGNGVANVGETISYQFTVTNTGQTTLRDIIVEDPLVTVSGSLSVLNPGQSNSTNFTATYSITQNDILNGSVENQALVEGCYDPQPVNPNGNCDGKVTSLELEYQGNVVDGTIKVIEHDGQIVFQGVVQPGERFEFFGQDPPQNTLGPKIDIYINNNFVQEIHTSCSQPIGPGAVYGDFEVIKGTSRNNGPLVPIAGPGCAGSVNDLSDDNRNDQDDPTIVPLPGPDPIPRDCNCAPLYKDASFVLGSSTPEIGTALQVGAVYRFNNVFPTNPYGTNIDALIRIEEFTGGASLLNMDVTSSGLPEAFQPRINSTNNLNQSVLFNITFVEDGGTYGDEVDMSFYATPLDIDGDGDSTREYAEVNLPDAYFVSNVTALNILQTATVVRGTANTVTTAPGGDVSLDPKYTFSAYYENKSSVNYRIGKLDGNSDRYYSLKMSCAEYNNPNSVLITYPVICGNVSDDSGNPLANVSVDVTGSDGSSQTVTTNSSGNYKAIAVIPEALVDVTYEIRENDPAGYISISDVDGANDNLITRVINLESTCGNDFVDGIEVNLSLVSKTNILCNGASTGSITVTTSGGIPPYSYTINGGAPQSSPTFNNLSAGIYNIQVSDSLGNTDSLSVTLTQPEPISIQITKTNASATALCQNGTATATPSGGVGPYTYQWSASAGNQTTQTATNLPGALIGGTTHSVVVTDANGCTAQQSVVITCVPNCDAVINIDSKTNVLCKNEMTGAATVSASSAQNPGATFTFTWNTVPSQVDAGVTTSTVTGLGAGVYTVSVTIDGTLCQPVQQSVTITEPSSSVNVTATATDETGPTTNDGTATANPSGGTPPYTFLWSPGGQTTQTITGLDQGTYTVTVTDANGCTATANAVVNEGSCRDLDANATPTNVSCNGGNDGAATVSVTGGLGPFTYSWSPGGQTTQTITGLIAGTYTVTVYDTMTFCTTTSTATVNEPTALSSGIAVDNVLCYGDSTGSLDLTVTGGTPPYTFLWSPNGETTEDLVNLAAGNYSVVITDANGCSTSNSATVMQPTEALTLNISSQTNIVCTGLGSVTVAATGGTSPYSYNIDGGAFQSSGTFGDLEAGTYQVSAIDSNGCTKEITVTILKNCTDAVNDINNTFTDIAVSGNVLTNDEDAEGDTQTVTTVGVIATTQGGSVVMNADGSYVYTPPTGYSGPDTFQYSIVDDGNPVASDTATVFIEVLPIGGQNITIANADTAGTEVNTPVDGNVLVNDFDPEGDTQTVTTVGTFATTEGGSITIAADGSFTYTPPTDFEGEDTFTYSITDDGFPIATDSAILTITVDGSPLVNHTYANDDAYNGTPGATITGNVSDNDSDPEGDDQIVNTTPVVGPTNGSLVLNPDGSFVYVPNDPTFIGTDSFIYSVCDTGTPQACDTATVVITIGGIPNSTDAVNDINNTFTDIAVSGNVLTNDEDAEGDTQTVTTVGVIATTQGGSVVMNADGSYVYTPPTGYSGPDTFQYSIVDDGNPVASDTATVFIEVLPIGDSGNQPPVANADTAGTEVNTPVDGNVLPNDFDPDGDTIVVTTTGTFTTSQGGSVTLNADGSFTYTPPTDFEGEDTFPYTICDDATPSLCDDTIVTITVDGRPLLNHTYANDDAYNGTPGATITGNVSDNDSDPEGDDQIVNTIPVVGPTNGSVILNPDGTFSYVPNDPTFTGTDSFVYSLCDTGLPQACDEATVYITIGETNNDILAIDDINNTFVNVPVSGDVGTNDDNFDGPIGNEVFTLITGPNNGGLVFNSDGTYTYTPNNNYIGEDTFEYQICDAGNPIACDTATVYIEVVDDPVIGNDPPVANADTNVTEVNTPVDGTVLVNDFDPDNDPIVVTANTPPSNGTVVVNPDGTYTYIPNTDFEGEDSFTYTICDNGSPALCDTATVTIQVIPNNGNITIANDDAYYGEINTSIIGNVLDNDNDPEANTQLVDIGLTPVSGPTNGSITIDANGNFTYTPNAGFTGTDQFVYAIFDNGAPVATDQATVYILIEETPAPAIAIVKTGILNDDNQSGCSDPGETLDYTFTVTNEGNVDLFNVSVTDPLLETPNPVVPIVFVSGDDGDGILQETETWIYTASYAITQADIDAGQVTNQATVEAADEDGTVVTDLSDDTSVLENDPTVITVCQSPVIAIVKTGVLNDDNQSGCSDPGETLDYTFTVTNEGNVSLSNISVTDPLLETPNPVVPIVLVSGDDGDGILQVTETWVYTASYAITQADIDAGQVTNQATAEGTAPDTTVVTDLSDDTSVLENDPTVVTVCQSPVIAIVKTGVLNDDNQSGCSDPGETLDYTFTVTNEGNVSLSNISVTDPLLETPNPVVPIVLVSGDDGDGILQVTETWVYTASYAITQADIDAGQVTNQATAEGTAPDTTVVTDLSDDTSVLENDPTVVTVCQSPSIALIKVGTFNDEDQDGCADVDETISYEFTVINTGNVTLSDVTVTDIGITVIGGPLATLAVGTSDATTFTATYTITQIDIDNGSFSNQAEASGTAPDNTVVTDLSDDNSPIEDDPTITELCQNGGIALIKTGLLIEDGGGCPTAGDAIEYTFTVVNTGNVSLTNVMVTDPLVAVVGGPISLAVGATDTTSFTATYILTQTDIDAGLFENQATATGETPSGTTVTDLSDDAVITEDDPTIVEFCQTAIIALVKVGTFNDENGDGCADVKETISYAFTAYNQGTVTLTNITINDPLVNVQGGPITLAPLTNDGTSFTATYVITQADINNGFVENQATITGTTLLGDIVTDESDDNSEFEDDPTITDLCQDPIIALIKTGTPTDENNNGCVDLGETIVYDFVVTNLGNVTLTNVTVTDPIVTVIGGPVTLLAGDSDTETFSAIYTVTQTDVDNGFVNNQATAEGFAPNGDVATDLSDDNSNFENDITVTVLCQDPSIAVEKTGVFNDENGDFISQPGETITYAFFVTNTGNVTLYNITLEDALPGVTINGGPIAVLEPGEVDETTFTGTYTITQGDIDAGEVVNQAEVTGYDINNNPVTDLSDDPNNPTNIDPNGDGNPDDPTVTILPGVQGFDFEIFNGVTPNGDGSHDYFQILGIENFPINNVKIYNRWGVLVFETDGYGGSNGKENVFTGVSEGRVTVREDKDLPTGTYYYVLTFPGSSPEDNPGQSSYAGYLYLNR